jgi:hypothetical protein
MSYTTKIIYEPLRSIDSATLSGSYLPIGNSLEHPGTIVKMVNNSTVLVTVSTDGVNDHDVCPAGSFWLYDETGNAPSQGSSALFLPEGTQIYVKGSPGTGDIYLVVQYIQEI